MDSKVFRTSHIGRLAQNQSDNQALGTCPQPAYRPRIDRIFHSTAGKVSKFKIIDEETDTYHLLHFIELACESK